MITGVPWKVLNKHASKKSFFIPVVSFLVCFYSFKLKHSCMLGRGWDDLLWWLRYRHCFDAVVSYYNSEWDITLKSVRILRWKGTTAKTACFSGCLNINQRLAVSHWHMCLHLKHRYYFTMSFFFYTKTWHDILKLKQKQRWTVSVMQPVLLVAISKYFWMQECFAPMKSQNFE